MCCNFFWGRNALVLLLIYSIWFHNRKLNIASVSRSSLDIALSEKPEIRRRLPRCHCWWWQCQSCLRLFHTWVWYMSCGVENLSRQACFFLFWLICLIRTVMIVGFMNETVMISLHIRRTLAQDDFCLWLIWQRYCDIRVLVKSKFTAYPLHPGSKLIFVCDWSLMIIKMILRWKLTACPPHPGSAFFLRILLSLCLDLNKF